MAKTNQKIQRNWYLIDAKEKILGRLSTKVANILYGKNKVNFMPNIDMGDYVVIINAQDIQVTGRKKEGKVYWRHTGYPGGIKKETLKELYEKKPEEIIKKAVKGMLPKNKIAREAMKRLRVYKDANYPKSVKEIKVID